VFTDYPNGITTYGNGMHGGDVHFNGYSNGHGVPHLMGDLTFQGKPMEEGAPPPTPPPRPSILAKQQETEMMEKALQVHVLEDSADNLPMQKEMSSEAESHAEGGGRRVRGIGT